MTDTQYNPYSTDDELQDAFFVQLTQNPPGQSTWAPGDAYQRSESTGQLADQHRFLAPNQHTELPGPLNGHHNMAPYVYQRPAPVTHITLPIDQEPPSQSLARSPTPESHPPSRSASPASLKDRSPSRSASPVSPEHRTRYSGKEYIGLITLVLELNPFAAKHGNKGAAWEEVAEAVKAKGLFKSSSSETIKNKALALIKYQEASTAFILTVAASHLLYFLESQI